MFICFPQEGAALEQQANPGLSRSVRAVFLLVCVTLSAFVVHQSAPRSFSQFALAALFGHYGRHKKESVIPPYVLNTTAEHGG